MGWWGGGGGGRVRGNFIDDAKCETNLCCNYFHSFTLIACGCHLRLSSSLCQWCCWSSMAAIKSRFAGNEQQHWNILWMSGNGCSGCPFACCWLFCFCSRVLLLSAHNIHSFIRKSPCLYCNKEKETKKYNDKTKLSLRQWNAIKIP